jgi:RNA polymerase sigma factor (TIGR02999 family)
MATQGGGNTMTQNEQADEEKPMQPDPDAVVADTYERLRRIAHQHLRRYRPGETLNTTAVVHEAYIKLAGEAGEFWKDRNEFFKVASTVMRHLIVDYARRQQAGKRGGGALMVTLNDAVPANGAAVLDVVALDDALHELGALDPGLERIVECRFFAGMTMQETAGVLQRPMRSVERDWARARAYLYDALER